MAVRARGFQERRRDEVLFERDRLHSVGMTTCTGRSMPVRRPSVPARSPSRMIDNQKFDLISFRLQSQTQLLLHGRKKNPVPHRQPLYLPCPPKAE